MVVSRIGMVKLIHTLIRKLVKTSNPTGKDWTEQELYGDDLLKKEQMRRKINATNERRNNERDEDYSSSNYNSRV
jgi:hypothetical protein